ncbi:MAG: metallopeptidase family protein [Ardenticatenia bacterium]|nr:metallopeptidase family protein [Ardenticatenia bacterium]
MEIVVEPLPAPEQLRRAGIEPPETLLGLYEGVPRTARGGFYHLVPPDRITIFQQPIEAISQDEEEMFRHIQETILHELAHHFGFDEAHIQALEQELGWGSDR